MSTIVTVHGTFAHMTVPGGVGAGEKQWWEADSACVADLKRQLGGDAAVDVQPFVWSGDNSVRARRNAGADLFKLLLDLESRGKPYAVIGHSHGGSVISAALMLAARRRERLSGLKSWITVGTPFVELRKERFLFLRLPLIYKALFVASLMLFLMFAFNFVAELLEGSVALTNTTRLQRYGIAGAIMTLPFVAFLIASLLKERGRLFFYRDGVQARARDWFTERWLPLTHEDDEAVRGLGSLDKVRFSIFNRDFAVPLISLLSVFLLPLAYLLLVNSPAAMVRIADLLKTEVYKLDQYAAAEQRFEARRRELRNYRREIRSLRQKRTLEERFGRDLEINADLRKLRRERRDLRQTMRNEFSDLDGISRALRFKRRFFETSGQLCAGDQLCGGGRNLAINSRLLLHIVTDEAANVVVGEDFVITGWVGRLISSLIPILLVPLVFAAVAIALVLLVQYLGHGLSVLLSRWLDRMTWSEIKRSALGNDTESEVAVSSDAQPPWMAADVAAPFLPTPLAAQVTEASNVATSAAISKFRDALSELAFADSVDSRQQTALAFLTWRELIHFAYFDVADFRKLMATALRNAGIGAATAEADDMRIAGWLASLKSGPVRTASPVKAQADTPNPARATAPIRTTGEKPA